MSIEESSLRSLFYAILASATTQDNAVEVESIIEEQLRRESNNENDKRIVFSVD